MNNIDFHADDYILTKNSDGDILDLCKNQDVDSISLMVNMQEFDTSIALLKEVQREMDTKIKMSIHLNFMEGYSVAPEVAIPDLVDGQGLFRVSWGKLLRWSYSLKKRKSIRQQLTTEILAQAHKTLESGVLGTQKLRFDSHQHPHMIPVVWEALLDAVDILRSEGYETEFIRNSRDILGPYLGCPKLYKTYSLVNMIKCFVLNFFSLRVAAELRKRNLPQTVVCGVFFSDYMDYARLKTILPSYIKQAKKKGWNVEVLFHPGQATKEELTVEFSKIGFNDFHISSHRHIERDSLRRLIVEKTSFIVKEQNT